MPASFSHIATKYDQDFTDTVVGKAQRTLVYEAMDSCIGDFSGISMLEINGGTGEDAVYFASKRAQIITTDISPQMVEIAMKKGTGIKNFEAEVLDIKRLGYFRTSKKYEVLFSNFGGLNCLNPSEMKQFLCDALLKLKSNGILILVIMPKFTVWESVYFGATLKWKQIFRRNKNGAVMANVEGQKVATYYYSPQEIIEMAKGFKVHKVSPIGFFIPPSYLSNKLEKLPGFMRKLRFLDQKTLKRAYLAPFSDHFFICLQKA